MSLQTRQMSVAEVHRISEIDVSESGDVVYKWVDGRVTAVPEGWQRPRSYGEGWQRRAEFIRARLAKGGMAFGAFDAGRLVGFIALQYELTGDVALLAALWVSRDHRRHGIATALVKAVEQAASENGAKAIYVSATPSRAAQAFYRTLGFRPTVFVHWELYDKEPEDIHMRKEL